MPKIILPYALLDSKNRADFMGVCPTGDARDVNPLCKCGAGDPFWDNRRAVIRQKSLEDQVTPLDEAPWMSPGGHRPITPGGRQVEFRG